jgi:hypothetical protein
MRREGNNILITLDEWQMAGLSYKMYENDKQRDRLQTVKRGCNRRPVEIIWQSIVDECRKATIKGKLGDPERKCMVGTLERYIRENAEIKTFFTDYELPDGQTLGGKDYKKAVEYYNNAIVLAAAGTMLKALKAEHRSKGNNIGIIWPVVANAVNELDRDKYPHTLPAHERRLRERYAIYQSEGPASLVHKSYGNNFARVVDERLERLILSIYCMTNKPYAAWVHEDYLAFIAGMIDIVDMRTGQLFDRTEFFNEKKGVYITISEATCWNYINNPKNRATVEAIRGTNHRYISEVRPHYHRHAAKWSLSKISLDDRDLPRRMHDGNRVKAYYAYDVCSGALIGAAYSVKKDTNLFIDCLRDMFRFIDLHGYGMPLEVEVEHHLVGQFKDDLMKAGVVFPFVRFCAPGNSQEKHAEQFNRRKKYGYEKRSQDGIGRFYSKLEANQTGGERVYDEDGNKYVIKEQTYSFEQLVADDRATIGAYNNGLHRNQKVYKGKTRLEVLHGFLNPDLAAINRAVLMRYIGECTTTSIQRNMYCKVQYADYMLPSPEIIGRLAPNNYTVQAYYLPDVGGGIGSVFIYQNNEFIAECNRVETFTTTQAEWTDADTATMTEQAKYIAEFDKMVEGGKANIAHVKEIKNIEKYEAVEAVEVETDENCEPVFVDGYSEEWQAASAMDSL